MAQVSPSPSVVVAAAALVATAAAPDVGCAAQTQVTKQLFQFIPR